MFDEVFTYLIFQRKDLLDDYASLSFGEMKEKMEDYRASFTYRQFFCPVLIDDNTKLPRVPSKDECIEWAFDDGKKEIPTSSR